MKHTYLITVMCEFGFVTFNNEKLYFEIESGTTINDVLKKIFEDGIRLHDDYIVMWFLPEKKDILDYALEVTEHILGGDGDSDAVHYALKQALLETHSSSNYSITDDDISEYGKSK